MNAYPSRAQKAIRHYMLLSGFSVAVLLFGAGVWAATSKLSGAVIGVGTVAVEGNVKHIQHREGGIVSDIDVRDGTPVVAGQRLIRLDDTVPRTNLAMISKQIGQLAALSMRLTAERDNAADLAVPAVIETTLDPAESVVNVQSERALFFARKGVLEGQKAQQQKRIAQLQQEADGLTLQRAARTEELHLVEQELTGVSSLHEKGLVPFSRLAELLRRQAQLSGDNGQLAADLARTETRRAETELQILQIDQDRRSEILTELRDVEHKIAELIQQQVAAKDQLRRIDILAPQDGIVHELTVHTLGGVVAPGETIMQIVPVSESLVVDARIHLADIDQIHIGQQVVLRFSAFNQRMTPEVSGTITTIAANLSSNPQTGEAWYSVRINIPKPELDRLGPLSLQVGMPVETFIQTGERTAFSYLLKPLVDQIKRAMREE